MKILTSKEMSATDQRTAAAGISLDELMEAAGAAAAAFILRRYPEAGRVLVLCGKGNNGGDGFVVARLLAAEGIGVRVLLAGLMDDVKVEAATALRRLLAATDEGVVEELSADAAPEQLAGLFEEADLIVDAVFGTGFRGPMRPGAAASIGQALRLTEQPVIAIDLPSGWDADSYDETLPGAFRADAVITFTAPKLAHAFGHLTSAIFGPVVVADIGSSADEIESSLDLTWTGASKALTEQARLIHSNKGRFGHVLVVGGSFGMAGAPAMASLSALRAGAGLVTAAVPRAMVNVVGAIAPELMVRPVEQGMEGSAALLTPAALDQLLRGIKVIAVGPALSTKGEAPAFARQLIACTQLPIVIDADALNAFDADHIAELQGHGRTMVLTPHPGEMARLLGTTVAAVEADRVSIARRFATTCGVTLVLKGWRTLVAHPDGRIAVNTTGNPALAKGGSGDTLTGVIAAMLAQHPEHVAEAVEAAVYLHGLAADLAVQSIDEKSVLATDVISHLSDAFRYRITDDDGLRWMCGVRSESLAKEQIA